MTYRHDPHGRRSSLGLPPGGEEESGRQTARYAMRPLAFLEERRERFGDVFTIRLEQEPPWVMVSDPGLITQTFKAPADVLHAGEGKEVLRAVLGNNSVLLLDEERHMEQRKLLLPPFRGDWIEGHGRVIQSATERVLDEWPLGEIAEATAWTGEIALEAILHVVFGEDDRLLDSLRDALREMQRPGNPREKRSPGFRTVLGRVDELIFAAIAASAGKPEGNDVLSLLTRARHDDGSPMSPGEIRDELMSLLVAGHETTAVTLAWALELLARHPEALARVEDEAEGGNGPYRDAVIRETLRLRPALPVVARAVKAPFDLGGYTIPPGSTIVPAILLVHHRPDLFPEPQAFRPERFLDALPDPTAWIPFGGGVRRCLGARFALYEMRVVLSTLLSHHTVRPAEPDAAPEAMRARNVVLTPARGARVRLEPR